MERDSNSERDEMENKKTALSVCHDATLVSLDSSRTMVPEQAHIWEST
jgi:hypothetical protein